MAGLLGIIGIYSITANAAPQESPTVSVMTYNVRNMPGRPCQGVPGPEWGWCSRIPVIKRSIDRINPDIIIFNEAADDQLTGKSNNKAYGIKDVLGSKYSFTTQKYNDGLIAWRKTRFEKDAEYRFWLPAKSRDGNYSPWVRLKSKLSGEILYVASVHFDPNRQQYGYFHYDQGKIVADYAAQKHGYYGGDTPVIVGGDFASSESIYYPGQSESYSGTTYNGALEMAAKVASTRIAFYCSSYSQYQFETLQAYRDSQNPKRCGTDKTRIWPVDQIYFSKGSGISVNKVVNTIDTDTLDASDHLPVTAYLNIPTIVSSRP